MGDHVLVTGASGFVGRELLQALRQSGTHIQTHSSADGDIADCNLPFEGVSHVFHLAAKTFVPDSWKSPREFYKTNVLGCVNVLDLCRRSGASLTFLSSYVYGRPERLPISEDDPVRAFNPYAHTKILAEEVIRYYGTQFGVRWTIIRPFNLYGPGQKADFLIPALVQQAVDPASTDITVADERPRRDYIHVRDLVRLLLMSCHSPSCTVLNAGAGRSYSIREIVNELTEITGREKRLRSLGQPRPDEVLDVVADASRARAQFGWSPAITMRAGLTEMVRTAIPN